MTLTRSGSIQVPLDGAPLADWVFKVVADAPPQISFTDESRPIERRVLLIPFSAEDDPGAAKA